MCAWHSTHVEVRRKSWTLVYASVLFETGCCYPSYPRLTGPQDSGVSCLQFSPLSQNAGIPDAHATTSSFCMGTGDLKSHPHAAMASAFPDEPPPIPRLCLAFGQNITV